MIFLNWHLYVYKKSDTLCYVTFYYKNLEASNKARQFALRFIYAKPVTLRYAIFRVIFEIGRGEEGVLMNKNQFTFR